MTVDLAVTDPGSPSPTDQADPSVVWRILDSAPPGSVLVIATHAQRLTVVGGVTAATACGRELAGIVTDGGIRDTDEIREYGIPIRYAFSDPRAMRDRLRVHAVGRPVRFGDVQVAPGDIVVGDADGVVCVPRHLADDVIGRAATIDGQERLWAAASRVLGSIAQGYEATAKVHGVPH